MVERCPQWVITVKSVEGDEPLGRCRAPAAGPVFEDLDQPGWQLGATLVVADEAVAHCAVHFLVRVHWRLAVGLVEAEGVLQPCGSNGSAILALLVSLMESWCCRGKRLGI
jgi:hypothetical protein